jgi:hypothetical protein
MATEDHDFEEIIIFKGKIQVEQGKHWTRGKVVYPRHQMFLNYIPGIGFKYMPAETLKNLFKDAYLNHDNLADATRHLAIHFFLEQGLVILDADDPI